MGSETPHQVHNVKGVLLISSGFGNSLFVEFKPLWLKTATTSIQNLFEFKVVRYRYRNLLLILSKYRPFRFMSKVSRRTSFTLLITSTSLYFIQVSKAQIFRTDAKSAQSVPHRITHFRLSVDGASPGVESVGQY